MTPPIKIFNDTERLFRSRSANVIIVGSTGSGKSAIGKQLAYLLGFGLLDTDDQIEKKQQCTIAKIFKTAGEGAFRELEHKLIASLKGIKNHVIVTGAGTIEDDSSWQLLRNLGRTVWISAPYFEIVARFERDPEELKKRPLLAEWLAGIEPEQRSTQLMAKLRELHKKREARYKEADIRLNNNFTSVANVAQYLKRRVCQEQGEESADMFALSSEDGSEDGSEAGSLHSGSEAGEA